MRNILLLAVALALAGRALADVNYNLAKDQAKRDVNQSNAQQGIQPPAPSAPGAPAAPPMDPALAATLQNVGDLKADLDALVKATDAEAGAEQRIPLLNHLSSAAATGKKATTASVKKIASQLITTISGKKNLSTQTTKLAQSLHALFNGAHLPAAQQETVLSSVKKILTDGGATADDTDKLVADLKQVAAETQ